MRICGDRTLQFTLHPAELIFRGSVIYLGLVLTFRFVLRRGIDSLGIADVLFIVLIADASQNAMAGEYKSITDGFVLIGTLIFWNVMLDWAAYRSPLLRRFIEPAPLPLIRNGKWIRRNLRTQWITTDEILSKLRERGIEDISHVRLATLEPDGEIGVRKIDRQNVESPTPRKPPGGPRGRPRSPMIGLSWGKVKAPYLGYAHSYCQGLPAIRPHYVALLDRTSLPSDASRAVSQE